MIAIASPATEIPKEPQLDTRDVARLLGVSRQKVRDLFNSGELRCIRIGRKSRRTFHSWVDEYLLSKQNVRVESTIGSRPQQQAIGSPVPGLPQHGVQFAS